MAQTPPPPLPIEIRIAELEKEIQYLNNKLLEVIQILAGHVHTYDGMFGFPAKTSGPYRTDVTKDENDTDH